MTEHIPLNPQRLDGEKVVLLRASKNERLRNFPEVQIRACTCRANQPPLLP